MAFEKEEMNIMVLSGSIYLRIPKHFARVFNINKKDIFECEFIEKDREIKIIYKLIGGRKKA